MKGLLQVVQVGLMLGQVWQTPSKRKAPLAQVKATEAFTQVIELA
jgi:hypothetical protein